METVAPHWEKLAIALGFTGPRLSIINSISNNDPEKAAREMFVRWLDGDHDLKPPTWGSLVQCLVNIRLEGVADSIKEILQN